MGEVVAEKVEFEVGGIYHAPDRTVIEWVQIMDFWNVPWTAAVPMRIHVHMRPDRAGRERISRYEEEWWLNKQLNSDTTFAPLGWLHESLRRWTGLTLAAAFRAYFDA